MWGRPMRRLFTAREAMEEGMTWHTLQWGETRGRWRRVCRGVYGEGPDTPNSFDREIAAVLLSGGAARGGVAATLHQLDIATLRGSRTTRRLGDDQVVSVGGIRCANGVQTLVDLAAVVPDLRWEQAMESALRRKATTIDDIAAVVPELGRARYPGTTRIRRVLALRPPGAAPTESLLETLMVQLVREVPNLPTPVRQLVVTTASGVFVARIDLAWPSLGLFIELDGQHHLGQPVYDASRETAIVATKGWLCGRFTWTEVVRLPESTRRRLSALAEQARLRPVLTVTDLATTEAHRL